MWLAYILIGKQRLINMFGKFSGDRSNLEAACKKIKKLKTRFKYNQKILHENAETTRNIISEQKAEIDRLRDQLSVAESLRVRNDQLEKNLETLQRNNDSLMEKGSDTQNLIDDLRKHLEMQKKERQRWEHRALSLQGQVEQLAKAMQQKTDQISRAQIQADRNADEHDPFKEKMPVSAEDHGPSDEKVAVSAEKHGPSDEKVAVSAEKHGPSDENVAVSAEKHGPSDEKVAVSAEKHGPSDEKVAVSAEKHGPSDEKMTVSAEDHGPSDEKVAVSAEKHGPSDEKVAVSAEEHGPSDEKIAVSAEEHGPSDEKMAVSAEEHGPSDEKMAVSAEDHGPSDEKMAVSAEDHGPSDEKVAVSAEKHGPSAQEQEELGEDVSGSEEDEADSGDDVDQEQDSSDESWLVEHIYELAERLRGLDLNGDESQDEEDLSVSVNDEESLEAPVHVSLAEEEKYDARQVQVLLPEPTDEEFVQGNQSSESSRTSLKRVSRTFDDESKHHELKSPKIMCVSQSDSDLESLSVFSLASLMRWPSSFSILKLTNIYSQFQRLMESVLVARFISVSPVLNKKIVIWKGDLTKLTGIDCVVNAAHETLAPGGGVCGTIHKVAGPLLYSACKEELRKRGISQVQAGDAVLTEGFGLSSKYVIHAVGPKNRSYDDLYKVYWNCLDLCKSHGIRSVAFCCISTGIFGFPGDKAAECALTSVRDWLDDSSANENALDSIVFSTFTKKDLENYHVLTPLFFPVE
jgi:O-acetyl-ADP-ribose deacetylase (regulator of RNase III)